MRTHALASIRTRENTLPLCLLLCWLLCPSWTKAQEDRRQTSDTISHSEWASLDLYQSDSIILTDVLPKAFNPSPTRAVIYSAVLPGMGQIYNKKYWKLPIVYGGFICFLYAVNWNNKNYHDYSDAYLHIMTDDVNKPESWHTSWQDFIPAGRDPNDYITNESFKSNLKNGKDFFRRNRDLSIILTVGWYILTITDAYVDAELFDFDVSENLSIHLEPLIIPKTAFSSQLFGVNCRINF